MSKYEVWVMMWSEEHKAQIKIVAGTFDTAINAEIFAKAYKEYYRAEAEIVEYVKK